MLPSLTCRLLFASSDAWRELTDADPTAHLPDPALHGAALGGLSAAIATLASSLGPHNDFGNVVRCTIAALSGGVGATALTTAVVPRLLRPLGFATDEAVNPVRAARYASAASLPLAASGWITALPTLTAALTALALLAALAYRSGSVGARVLWDREGSGTMRLAIATSLVATLPSLLAAPLHAVR